jgi:hypothetical protein
MFQDLDTVDTIAIVLVLLFLAYKAYARLTKPPEKIPRKLELPHNPDRIFTHEELRRYDGFSFCFTPSLSSASICLFLSWFGWLLFRRF